MIVAAFKLGMEREIKEDGTPVTETDKLINEMVLNYMQREFPGVRVIGEEASNDVESNVVVLVDPIDGTIPFCHGIPTSAFCAAVVVDGRPEAAVILDPFHDRMWNTDRDAGAWLNNSRVRVSQRQTVKGSHVCPIWWNEAGYNMHAVVLSLMEAGARWMYPASIAYWGGLVASGEFDATIFPSTKGWETAAMSLIVEEAGGKATDILGNPLVYGPNGEIEGHIISNGLIHDELVKIVRASQPL